MRQRNVPGNVSALINGLFASGVSLQQEHMCRADPRTEISLENILTNLLDMGAKIAAAGE
jgi:hypothetical protein